jgi:GT2 family glycosyltransferase
MRSAERGRQRGTRVQVGQTTTTQRGLAIDRESTGDRRPTIGLVVPVRNGAAVLDRCLDAIGRSTLTPDEVLIVDDASDDDSAAVATRHGARVLCLPHRVGPAAARNRGVLATSSDIVVFTDADVCLHEDAVARAVAALGDGSGVDAVIGSYDDSPADPSFLAQYKNLFHHWVHQTSREEASTFWSGCGAIRRRVFLSLGGFNEGYRRPSIEDIELGFRLRRAGHRIRLDKRMLGQHLKRWCFWNLLRTDLLLRGTPWIALMLRDRHGPNDLNLSAESKAATLLTGLLCALVVVLPLAGHAAALLPLAGLLLAAAGSSRLSRLGPTAPVLCGTTPVAVFAVVPDPLGLAPLTVALAVAGTHGDLYRFFAARRGVAFACAALPMQLLFHFCCGLSVPLGMATHLLDRRRARHSAHGPAVRELPPLAADERVRSEVRA